MLVWLAVGDRPLRRTFVFSAMLVFTLCGGGRGAAQDARAIAPEVRPQLLSASTGEKDAFVELVAADFFESDLRLAQSRQIEAATAERYLSLDAAGRAQFREKRRAAWRRMSDQERAALRGAKRPRFANLDEAQKQTFRRIASQELGAGSNSGFHPGDI